VASACLCNFIWRFAERRDENRRKSGFERREQNCATDAARCATDRGAVGFTRAVFVADSRSREDASGLGLRCAEWLANSRILRHPPVFETDEVVPLGGVAVLRACAGVQPGAQRAVQSRSYRHGRCVFKVAQITKRCQDSRGLKNYRIIRKTIIGCCRVLKRMKGAPC
jgi:hypothetical protein